MHVLFVYHFEILCFEVAAFPLHHHLKTPELSTVQHHSWLRHKYSINNMCIHFIQCAYIHVTLCFDSPMCWTVFSLVILVIPIYYFFLSFYAPFCQIWTTKKLAYECQYAGCSPKSVKSDLRFHTLWILCSLSAQCTNGHLLSRSILVFSLCVIANNIYRTRVEFLCNNGGKGIWIAIEIKIIIKYWRWVSNHVDIFSGTKSLGAQVITADK